MRYANLVELRQCFLDGEAILKVLSNRCDWISRVCLKSARAKVVDGEAPRPFLEVSQPTKGSSCQFSRAPLGWHWGIRKVLCWPVAFEIKFDRAGSEIVRAQHGLIDWSQSFEQWKGFWRIWDNLWVSDPSTKVFIHGKRRQNNSIWFLTTLNQLCQVDPR